jgi:hypothetical protein
MRTMKELIVAARGALLSGAAGSLLPSARMGVDPATAGADRSALKLHQYAANYGMSQEEYQRLANIAPNGHPYGIRIDPGIASIITGNSTSATSLPQAQRPKPAPLFHCKCCGRPVTEAHPPRDQTGTACNPCLGMLENMIQRAPELVKARLAAYRLSGPPKAPQQDQDDYVLEVFRQRASLPNRKFP